MKGERHPSPRSDGEGGHGGPSPAGGAALFSGRQLTGADLLCRALLDAGVGTIFGIPGGAIMPFYHALPDHPGLRHVLCRHEQGAGHAAQGYSRAGGGLGVCVATSGPGATNLVTPIADAWMDGTPLLAITGQVASPNLGSDAFQETDIIGITLPIVKHSWLVTDPAEIPRVVAEAVWIATSGRPGPVLVDVTKDAQQARVTRDAILPPMPRRRPAPGPLPAELIERAVGRLAGAERPMILAGQGVVLSGAGPELLALAERLDIPVATTLLGLGGFPQNHRLSVGMAGMHGEVAVNRGLQRCDVLLSVGARFDDRVTGRIDRFAPGATIVHVDIEPAQIGKVVPTAVELTGDAREVLSLLGRAAPAGRRREWREWLAGVARERGRRADRGPLEAGGFPPLAVYQALDAELGLRDDVRLVTDVGQHQMWAAQHLTWRRPGTHLTSGGAGTMGFALPAGLGAALARPAETIWAIAGDGGFQMTAQELATVVQEGIRNLKIAVVNNGYLGMVRQWQQLFHGRRYSGTPLSGPDFAALARAFGIHALTVDRPEDAAAAVAEAQARPETVLIDFRVEREANVFPIAPPGVAIDAMIESEATA